MKEVSLNLLDAEVMDIIRVLEQLPTGSGAWPLYQKLKGQLQEQTEQPEAVQ